MSLDEAQLIAKYFDRAHSRTDVALGIGDDAALTTVAAGMQLVSATDTIVAGVHFPLATEARHIGHRALAVNLSDLAAMGADPCWALLSLCCPEANEDWLEAFAAGFFALAASTGVALIGGDLVRGPLSIGVTVLGQVPAGQALTRSGARAGDSVGVTGTPGAAAAGLAALRGGDAGDPDIVRAFLEPAPRLEVGIGLRGLASAAIDLSDGLATDAQRLAVASSVAVKLETQALRNIARGGDAETALRGGDDYELLFTLPADRRDTLVARARGWPCAVHAIGKVGAGSGLHVPGYDIARLAGYDHFAS